MPRKPALSNNPDWLRAARTAVDDFVAELQAGIDSGDAAWTITKPAL
jgi:hypothetical protein